MSLLQLASCSIRQMVTRPKGVQQLVPLGVACLSGRCLSRPLGRPFANPSRPSGVPPRRRGCARARAAPRAASWPRPEWVCACACAATPCARRCGLRGRVGRRSFASAAAQLALPRRPVSSAHLNLRPRGCALCLHRYACDAFATRAHACACLGGRRVLWRPCGRRRRFSKVHGRQSAFSA